MPNGKAEEVDSEWTATFRPWTRYHSVDADRLAALEQQVGILAETCRQMQAMIYEMWSGERSEVIITPPSASRGSDESILRLDS